MVHPSTHSDDPGAERGSVRAQRIGGVLGVALFLAALFVPGLPLDGPQRRVLATTLLTATLWISVALPIGATSLLPAVLLPLFGVAPAGQVAPLYMRDLVFLFLGAFIVALGLERWGVHRRIALFILDKVGGSPRRLVLGFMAASAFLSLWINNTATTLMMLPIAMATLGRAEEAGDDGACLDERARRNLGYCLLLGVAYAASVGGMGTPVGTAPNQEFLGQFAARYPHGPKLTFGQWTVAWLPLVALFVPLAWLVLTRFVFPVPVAGGAGAEAVRDERRKQGAMSTAQKRMAALFTVTAIAWVFRADLRLGEVTIPGWSRLLYGADAADPEWYRLHKNDVSDATVATVMAVLAFVVPGGKDREGRRVGPLMDWRTANKLPWEVLLLLGGGFCLAHGFKTTGLDKVLGASLAPLFEGHATWLVVAGVALFMSFLTEVTSNTATTAVLLPVVAAAASEAGIDPLIAMVPATIAASAAFMLPVATPPNAVVFASRRVPVPVMARAGIWLNFMTVALITLVFELWVRRMWGIDGSLPDWAR